ncbi:MAG TPA: dihydroorotate oxidase [archaeon]|nr:dihydroorotate oxidase [archaeon]
MAKEMLSNEISGVKFNPIIMNASGPKCTYEDELKKLAASDTGAVVLKSTTVEPRKGNPKPKYWDNEFGSINSNGLENLGYKKTAEMADMLAKEFRKPVIPSIAGLHYEDYLTMAEELGKTKAAALEINLSCPNIPGKPQVAYDSLQSKKVLEKVRELTNKPLFIKLPPYLELIHQDEILEILLEADVQALILINSVANTLSIDAEKEQATILPKKGLGGLGGKFIKPVALGQVWSFHNKMKEKGKEIPIIGVGGIYSGTDAFEFLLAGASAVQVGTAYYQEEGKIFRRLKEELMDLLEAKNYKNVKEVIGKLKTIEER